MKVVWNPLKKNKGALFGLCIIGIFVFLALFAPLLAPYKPDFIFENQFNIPPIWQEDGRWPFILGTDDIGRDLLSRLIYGARISLAVGFVVSFLALLIGGTLGLLAGFIGGRLDELIMRGVDILMALPSILLAVVMVAVLGPSLVNGVLAVTLISLPGFIRIVRASVMVEKEKSYVMASESFGIDPLRKIFFHILPNCLAPIIVQTSLTFSDGILNVAALGFLGLGAQPPTAEWGAMLSDARSYITISPWLVTLPGLCILIVVLSFNLMGDGLRDALDSKLKGVD